jgi:hypothetical protein
LEKTEVIIARLPCATLIRTIAFALAVSWIYAPPASQGDDAPTTSENHDQPTFPSARSMIAPQVASLEDDLAQLVQKRDSAAAATLPWMDIQIDSRIFLHWLLAQSAAGREYDSEQITGYLHAASMQSVLTIVDDYASKQSAAPNAVQTVGLSRLHDLTFQLKHADGTAGIDKACADVAQDVLIAITPMNGGDRLPALVPMRPAVSPASAPAEVSPPGQSGPKSIDDLAALARQASVSPPLRRQLIAMANLAQQAQADSSHPQESQTLSAELSDALDLVAGLQANTAVTTDERGQIEKQLCDALALFDDPRMRDAGRSRLAPLGQYRLLLDRVQKMQLPPELKDALSPALTWAHDNPDHGDKVLSALEKFVRLHLAHDAKPQQPGEYAALRPNDPLRRAYESVNKQFIKADAEFLSATANIDAAVGSGVESNSTRDGGNTSAPSGPEALDDRAAEMARLEDLLDVLGALPKTIETLDSYKPRPTGGIERRVNSMLSTIDSPIKSPAREEASRQLLDLHKLASLANQLANQPVDQIPPAVAQSYSGDQIAGLQTKWKSMVIEMSGAFSANQPIDSGRLDRLKAASGLLDALGPAADMEAAIANPDGLAKWADWLMTPQQIHAMIEPYRQATSQAFTGFISDNPDALAEFARLRPRYEPMMALIARAGGYAGACAQLPDGTLGLIARLATPYAKAPFADQRFASFIAAIAASASDDPESNETAATIISSRIGR